VAPVERVDQSSRSRGYTTCAPHPLPSQAMHVIGESGGVNEQHTTRRHRAETRQRRRAERAEFRECSAALVAKHVVARQRVERYSLAAEARACGQSSERAGLVQYRVGGRRAPRAGWCGAADRSEAGQHESHAPTYRRSARAIRRIGNSLSRAPHEMGLVARRRRHDGSVDARRRNDQKSHGARAVERRHGRGARRDRARHPHGKWIVEPAERAGGQEPEQNGECRHPSEAKHHHRQVAPGALRLLPRFPETAVRTGS